MQLPRFARPAAAFPARRKRGEGGLALIVVLFAVALVSIVVLAYFNLAMMNRNISFSSAGEARANIVALSALDYVKGDLISEIQYGSTLEIDPNGSKIPVYSPITNTTMAPYRMTANLATPDYTLPPNLVKWSSGTVPQWTNTAAYGTAYGPTRGSTSSTTSPAINGHFLAASFWTKPVFGTNTTFSSSATPQWVYMSRHGPLTPTTANSGNMSALNASASTNYVIGRYAFTVYDEGGLLDVAAAGYSPDTMSSVPTDVGRKGSQGYADLTQLGLSTGQVDQLVGWRNSTSASNAAAYIGYLTTNAPGTGFLTAATNDQAFLSRQDLISFWTSPTQMGLATTAGTNALTYLTTFSREKNAPSWGPEHDAADFHNLAYWYGSNVTVNPNSIGNTISYAYLDNANSTNAPSNPSQPVYNRFVPNVRVTTPFARLNNETAVVGEPLIKNRFDLSKLAWISYNGTLPTGVTATDVYNYFGLTRNSTDGSWTYNHGTAANGDGNGKTILRLDEVAANGREPDFFELLQAVILQGALGLCSGDPTQPSNTSTGGEFARLAQGAGDLNIPTTPMYRYDVNNQLVYAQEKYQIIQIGANMIDQADADNYPTEIVLNGEHFYGIENLPYISALADTTLRPAPSSISLPVGGAVDSNSNYQAFVHRWLTFSLWNPHQNAAYPPATGPTVFRICVTNGNEYPRIHNLPFYELTTTAGYDYSGRIFQSPSVTTLTTTSYGPNTEGPAWIGFTNTTAYFPNLFSEPTALAYGNTFTSPGSGQVNMNDPDGRVQTKLGWQRAGIYMGWSLDPDYTNKTSLCAPLWTAPQTPPHYTNPTVALGSTPDELTWVANSSTAAPSTAIGLTVDLQFLDTAGNWHTFQELRGLAYSRDGQGDGYMEPLDPEWAKWTSATKTAVGYATGPFPPLATYQDSWVNTFLDPRAQRLNISTLRSGSANVLNLTNNYGSASSLTTATPIGPHFQGATAFTGTNGINNITNTIYYSDRDFVPRVADGAGWLGASPMPVGAAEQRPLHLNRPFRSVGELGYVFRDDPWKTLNLISANSADAGLLDAFYVGTTNATTANLPPPDNIAGKLNINSAVMNSVYANSKGSVPLQSLLAQGLRYYSLSNPTVIDSGSTNCITANDAATLATNIVSFVQTNNLIDIGDLPGVFPQNQTLTTANPGLKAPREALIRSLAGSAGTRTWNLMIDVVAQSGKFNPNAVNLNNFTVDGEKHYWLHVAIDRLTGEIVDEQLEPVWE